MTIREQLQETFEGHAGRPGQRGGSAPRGGGGGKKLKVNPSVSYGIRFAGKGRVTKKGASPEVSRLMKRATTLQRTSFNAMHMGDAGNAKHWDKVGARADKSLEKVKAQLRSKGYGMGYGTDFAGPSFRRLKGK